MLQHLTLSEWITRENLWEIVTNLLLGTVLVGTRKQMMMRLQRARSYQTI